MKPFRNVGASREDRFDATQVRTLIAKAAAFDKAFANLCEAAYLTGARYGELAAFFVRDFANTSHCALRFIADIARSSRVNIHGSLAVACSSE